MKYLIQKLIIKNDKQQLSSILEDAVKDVFHVYAVIEDWKNKKLFRNEFQQYYLRVLAQEQKVIFKSIC